MENQEYQYTNVLDLTSTPYLVLSYAATNYHFSRKMPKSTKKGFEFTIIKSNSVVNAGFKNENICGLTCLQISHFFKGKDIFALRFSFCKS